MLKFKLNTRMRKKTDLSDFERGKVGARPVGLSIWWVNDGWKQEKTLGKQETAAPDNRLTKIGQQNSWKCVAWSDESWSRLGYSDGKVRLLWWWCGGYFMILRTNSGSFKHNSLPEYRCRPRPSLYHHSVSSSDSYFQQDNAPCLKLNSFQTLCLSNSEECFQHPVESIPQRIRAAVKRRKGIQPSTRKVYLVKLPVTGYLRHMFLHQTVIYFLT